jgi:hypothetical protein
VPTIGVATMITHESLETEWLEAAADTLELLVVMMIVAALWWLL